MASERYKIVRVENEGLGVLVSEHAHYAVIRFNHEGHSWLLAVEHDDYEVESEIGLGYEEI